MLPTRVATERIRYALKSPGFEVFTAGPRDERGEHLLGGFGRYGLDVAVYEHEHGDPTVRATKVVAGDLVGHVGEREAGGGSGIEQEPIDALFLWLGTGA